MKVGDNMEVRVYMNPNRTHETQYALLYGDDGVWMLGDVFSSDEALFNVLASIVYVGDEPVTYGWDLDADLLDKALDCSDEFEEVDVMEFLEGYINVELGMVGGSDDDMYGFKVSFSDSYDGFDYDDDAMYYVSHSGLRDSAQEVGSRGLWYAYLDMRSAKYYALREKLDRNKRYARITAYVMGDGGASVKSSKIPVPVW